MANEITVDVSLSAFKAAIMAQAIGRSLKGGVFTMSGNFCIQAEISVPVAGIAIPMGQVVAPGFGWFLNLDPTNFIRLANGSGGAKLPKLRAGWPSLIGLDDTATLWAFADTAPCQLEYLIVSA